MDKDRASLNEDRRIAIIGMAGVFPGAKNTSEFWDNLINGVESIKQFSKNELLQTGLIPESFLNNPDYIRSKGYLEDATLFAANFFGITDKKAKILDPQFRLFLECVWNSFEDAGYNPKSLNSNSVGVYASSSTEGSYYYHNLLFNQELLKDTDSYELLINNAKDFMATFVAYYLNFKGPCLNIQTACSSSLVAITKACDDLIMGKCDMAVAGGMSITFPLKNGFLYKSGMIYSKDGHCKAFSSEATGLVPGNGGGVVLLKLLSEAKKANDRIYAVIDGYAVNNDGHNKLSYTAPSIEGQHDVLVSAAEMANIDPSEINYIEAHGSGTRLGDQIEIAAIKKFLSSAKKERLTPCIIGSVKSNIGHLDVASGVAGFIKAVMVLKNSVIPKTLYCDEVNSEISKDELISIASEINLWKFECKDFNRHVGVSSFGVGGTNAHVILSSFENKEDKKIHEKPIKSRNDYYISPPLLHNNLNPSDNAQEFLYIPRWKESKAEPIGEPLNFDVILIIQDKLGLSHDIFNALVNEYVDSEIVTIPFFDATEAMSDILLHERILIWLDILSKYKNAVKMCIIHISFFTSAGKKGQIFATNFYDFIALAKAISQLSFDNLCDIISIGNGLISVDDEGGILPFSNVLLGPFYCLPLEYPSLNTRAIDIGLNPKRSEILRVLQREFNINDGERLVAYRNNARYTLTLSKMINEKKAFNAIKLKKNGIYFISGGLGGLGLVFAEYLASHYQAKLILISKNEFPSHHKWESILNDPSTPEKIAKKLTKLLNIKKQASDLFIIYGDVGDQHIMQKIVTQSIDRFGEIHGVIHAASAYPEGLAKDKNISKINDMFRSKIDGLMVLESLFKDAPIDFMMLCSSLNTYQGSAGAIDYIAANAYMDACVQSKIERKYPIISVNWDVWKEVGMRHDFINRGKTENNSNILNVIKLDETHWRRILLGHRLNENHIIPGAMLLEILLKEVSDKNDFKFPVKFLDITFMNMASFSVLKDNELKMVINANQIKVSQEVSKKIIPILQAEVFLNSLSNELSNQIIVKKTNELKDGEDIVLDSSKIKNQSIQLGEQWDCLQWVKKSREYYLGYISLSEKFHGEIDDYILHPALLDVAYSFHAKFLDGQYVPFYIKSMLVFSTLPSSFYSIIQIKKYQKDLGMCVCDVILLDENNKVIIKIEDFTLKCIGARNVI